MLVLYESIFITIHRAEMLSLPVGLLRSTSKGLTNTISSFRTTEGSSCEGPELFRNFFLWSFFFPVATKTTRKERSSCEKQLNFLGIVFVVFVVFPVTTK